MLFRSTPEARIINDDILGDEIEKITNEVDHALKISDGHKNYLEKHLEKRSEIVGGPSYTKQEKGDLEGIIEPPATPAGKAEAAETPLDTKAVDDLASKLESARTEANTPAADTPGINPLDKPQRHNETLAIDHVDDVATPDIIGNTSALSKQHTSEVSSTQLEEMAPKVVDSASVTAAQGESTSESIPVSKVGGESGNEPELETAKKEEKEKAAHGYAGGVKK